MNKLLALLDAQDSSDDANVSDGCRSGPVSCPSRDPCLLTSPQADQDFESRNIAVGIAIGMVMMGFSDTSDLRYSRLLKLLRYVACDLI